MKGSVAILDHLRDGREIAALMRDGRLEDVLVDAPASRLGLLPGAILRGIVGRPMKGQGGVILRLPDGQSGFLRESRGLSPGQPLLVQVATVAEPGKAPPVTTRILFRSRYAILTPGAPGRNISRRIAEDELRADLAALADAAMSQAPEEIGLILRSACATADPDAVSADIAETLDLARAVLADADGKTPERLVDAPSAHLAAWRDWEDVDEVDERDGALADHAVADALAPLLRPDVALSDGSMAVEATRALVAVDVNTGADASPGAGLRANVAALRELPRQLRLRGLGGQIVIDPAPFPKKEKAQLEQVLKSALRRDGSETSIAGWTPLGHLELQRKRDRIPLAEVLKDVLPDL